jgi:hypothetical protein
MADVFREAQLLMRAKKPWEMTEDERSTVAAAMIPFGVAGMPFPENITIDEGLEMLAMITEEADEKTG